MMDICKYAYNKDKKNANEVLDIDIGGLRPMHLVGKIVKQQLLPIEPDHEQTTAEPTRLNEYPNPSQVA